MCISKGSVECNNCGWIGDEEDLTLIQFNIEDDEETPTAIESHGGAVERISEEPTNVDYLKGCPECLTDSYLMDL